MNGERAGTRTQDLQIKSNFGSEKSDEETTETVSSPRGIIRQIASVGDAGLETIGDDIRVRWNARRLQALFTRQDDGWGARDAISAGYPLFAHSGLSITWRRLPLAACKKALRLPADCGRARESRDHRILKRAGLLWMHSEGATDALEEMTCPVGRADAYSADRNWIVECGKTGVSKLANAVASGQTIRFSLIPYQYATWDDEKTPRRLIAVEFSWSPEFSKQVDAAMWAAADRHSALSRLIGRA